MGNFFRRRLVGLLAVAIGLGVVAGAPSAASAATVDSPPSYVIQAPAPYLGHMHALYDWWWL